MKIIFMGTPDFALPSLNALVEAGHEIICVVAQPDKPKGRGKKLVSPPTIERARELGLPTKQPRAVRRGPFVEWMKSAGADLAVVIAYGRILIPELLEAPKLGCINVHASLLPKYRGAAPIHWAIINGETETGACTMQMDEGMDTGDVLLERKLAIKTDETTAELWDRLAEFGARTLIETLENLEQITPKVQEHDLATHAPLITKSLGEINWNQPSTTIHNLVRGCVSWPVAHSSLRGKTIKIWKTRVCCDGKKGQPGAVVSLRPFPCIATQDGCLELLEIQMPSKRRASADCLVNGFKLQLGEILGSAP
jgi:methionyl-tRNA formyltransferase